MVGGLVHPKGEDRQALGIFLENLPDRGGSAVCGTTAVV